MKTTDCTNCGHPKEKHSLPSEHPLLKWKDGCAECVHLENETRFTHQCYGGYCIEPGGFSDSTCSGRGGHKKWCPGKENPSHLHAPYTHCGCGARLPHVPQQQAPPPKEEQGIALRFVDLE